MNLTKLLCEKLNWDNDRAYTFINSWVSYKKTRMEWHENPSYDFIPANDVEFLKTLTDAGMNENKAWDFLLICLRANNIYTLGDWVIVDWHIGGKELVHDSFLTKNTG